jgi:hypothetical protein
MMALDYYCPACQAFPQAGYCKLAGCPTAPEDDPECTDCGGSGVTYQTERRCACQPPVPMGPLGPMDYGSCLYRLVEAALLHADEVRDDAPRLAAQIEADAGMVRSAVTDGQ